MYVIRLKLLLIVFLSITPPLTNIYCAGQISQNNSTSTERIFSKNYISSERPDTIQDDREFSGDSSDDDDNDDEEVATTIQPNYNPYPSTKTSETTINTSVSTQTNTSKATTIWPTYYTSPSTKTNERTFRTFPPQTDTSEATTTASDEDTIAITTQPQSVTCHRDKIHHLHLFFEKTPAGTWAVPHPPCFQANYTIVRRYCFENGTWGKIQGKCLHWGSFKNTTSELNHLRFEDPVVALRGALNIVNNNSFINEIEPIDVHFISEILGKASHDPEVTDQHDNFYEIVDRIMGSKKDVLQSSQQLLNSTDNILYNLDTLLLKASTPKFSALPSLLVHTVNTSTGVIGGMIKNNGKGDTFTSFQVVPLYDHNSTEDLEKNDFEIAFQVPPNFTQNHDYYYITLFHNDHLFNEEVNNSNFSVGSWIISILIPDIVTDNSNIRIYFKEFTTNLQRQCDHWYYGKDENNLAIKGQWNFDSDVIKFRENFYICEINHTTHFGMLVSGSFADNVILDYLTIFGSILSVAGIAIIFLTALFFKNWRNNPSNTIILNVSTCLLLVIIFFFISDWTNEGIFCIIVGILLHYMILAQFCWMLVISYSNFRRLRLSLHYHIENVILKYCLIAWGIPIIIVAIVSGLSVETYNKNNDQNSSEICYPKGMYFKLGLLLPIGIILTFNLVIYILIINTITVTQFDLRKHTISKSYSQQKSIFLLFFMLGMTWIFGLLAAFIDSIVFTYLFCTTATYQGFVIFLFYILDSTNTKELWKNKLQKLLNIKRKPKEGGTSDYTLQSTSTKQELEL